MAELSTALEAHLASGVTTMCRAWKITRRDGVSFGFTDHDMGLAFEGTDFKADTGLSASALAQSTGLSVDNSEAMGALSDASVTEADIEAGRFDGADVSSWLVNWSDPEQRYLQFRGNLGELRRAGGAFTAELRGLTDALSRPLGRVFQKPCTAVLGDAQCGFDLDAAGYRAELVIADVEDARVLTWDVNAFSEFAQGWFARGRLDVLSGAGQGLWSAVKKDVVEGETRRIELWEPIRASLASGDAVRISAGCDKRFETCRLKFANVPNFQGFPDLPGEDWMVSVPRSSRANSGGSLR